jgi:hypothetical protein
MRWSSWRERAYHVEEAGPPFLLRKAGLAEEVLLGVASDLRRGACRDEVPGDASPVAFPELLQAGQESPVLILCPRNPCSQFSKKLSTLLIQLDIVR